MSELPTPALRAAVHALLDPLWLNAMETGGYKARKARSLIERNLMVREIQRVARERVYDWLAEQMWLCRAECHVTKFTVDQCHEAIDHLREVNYRTIRDWAHSRSETKRSRRKRVASEGARA